MANKIANNNVMKTRNGHFFLIKALGGLFIGFANGFFGGGGGMLAVPFLFYILKQEEKVSHATAIFIILPISIVSGIVYILNRVVEWDKLIPLLIGVLIGGVFGALFLNKIKEKTVGVLFAIVMIVAGIRMVI